MHKDFPCGLCNLQQFPTDSSRGRGGLNLHSPVLREPPPPQTWIFAEIDRGDRKSGPQPYINTGFQGLSRNKVLPESTGNPVFLG